MNMRRMSSPTPKVDKVFEVLDGYISARRNADPELKPPAVISISDGQAILIEAWATGRRQDKAILSAGKLTHYRGIKVNITGR